MPERPPRDNPARYFEAARIWPIRVALGRKRGYTWWARWEDAHEEVLALGSTVVLCRTRPSLIRFTLEQHAVNLIDHPGYRQLRSWVTSARRFAPDATIDCNRAVAALERDVWSQWSLSTCASVLDSWNMLHDFARTVGDSMTLDELHARTPIGAFLDLLTFMDDGALARLDSVDKPLLRDAFAGTLERLDRRLIVIE